jgi:hypothetical protein
MSELHDIDRRLAVLEQIAAETRQALIDIRAELAVAGAAVAWSEDELKKRIEARAAELGVPLRKLLADAGIAHDTMDKAPASGRRVDTLERVAAALRWTLADVMGFNMLGRISRELSAKAFASAERIIAHLPSDAQTRENLIQIHADIYDALVARQRDGRPFDDETLRAYEEIQIAAWEGKAVPPRAP